MRRFVLPLVAAAVIVGMAVPARAATVVTAPGGFLAGFVPPVVVVAEGEGITYVNGDIAPHNFVAADAFVPKKEAKKTPWCSSYDKGKCPLFWSQTISAGATTEVEGLERVVSGQQYGFLCTVHPNMNGTLIVR